MLENFIFLGIYGIIDENNNYATCIAPIQQKLIVSKIEDATCEDGKLYKVLYINKDEVMIDNNDLVINDNQIYYIYDQFYVKGIIPFYISYNLLPTLLAESGKYNGTSIGHSRLVFEILSSIVARGKDKNEYYRNSPELGKENPNWVSLGNIYYSLKSTSSKIIGGYYGTGISVAVLNQEEEASALEKLLLGKG